RPLRHPGHPQPGFHAGDRRHPGHRHHLSCRHAGRRPALRRLQPEGPSGMSAVTLPKRDTSARREMWARAFYRFRQSLLSVVGLALVLALIVIALLAPWIVPYPVHVAGAT